MTILNRHALGERSSFDGPDGTLSYYRTGTGEPLILLHSLALSAPLWAGIVDDFSATHDVVALDQRGHGQSTWSKEDFSIADLANDVIALMDHLGLASADVLGLSMGGSVALTLAGLYPDRVRRLVLCDTTAWYGSDAPEAWRERATQAASRARYLQIAFQVDRWYSEEFRRHHPEQVSLATGLFLSCTPAVHAAACRCLGAFDSRDLLGQITASTLVICGEGDLATPPEMAKTIADGVDGAELVIAPGRHFSIFESESLRQIIVRHLNGETVSFSFGDDLSSTCCKTSHGAVR